MKNLKSVLAITMVLVIGVCLTGCGAIDKKAANAEFETWFKDITLTQNGIIFGFTEKSYDELADFNYGRNSYYVTYKDDAGNNIILDLSIPDIAYAEITSGENVYYITSRSFLKVMARFSNMRVGSREDIGKEYEIDGMSIDFPESVQGENIDSFSLILINNNGEKETLTYYPNAE
ncbi:MAG: hypothetical protein LBL87_05135 [Ruminococcus sp.]|jgi:uncharacterized lipoprotein YehR (DUF1307 family)|nr:hypothetical protein [Ruminococcus sp.]